MTISSKKLYRYIIELSELEVVILDDALSHVAGHLPDRSTLVERNSPSVQTLDFATRLKAYIKQERNERKI